jgi:eukaryotic-like serine/threonine-protein kinase
VAKVKLLDPTDSRRRLDRYELIGEIASGGMATVFLARLAGVGGFQRFVAIKRLHPHLSDDQEFVEMFLDEARLAAGIHHPHVVPILEVGTSESGFYLVMEYIEGDTLARVVARALSGGKGVPRPILLRIILDALAGLHAAHEVTDAHGELVQLVHRDCSPQNILVGVDGCSRLTDFGVARASARLSQTRADRLKGKLAYMSPEQAKGVADIDRRADIFSMGVVLWEVLAGRRLFKAENEAATLTRVLIDPIPRLATAMPSIPKAFDDVCARALERDPDKRFRTVAEFADAVERAAREGALSTPNDLGVASPREVAAYVSAALGQDIAAQRESVRAWLQSGSEPSVNERGPTSRPFDRTVRFPIEKPDDPVIEIAAGSLTLVDLVPDSGPPDTLIGMGKQPPAARDRDGGEAAPSSGRTMVGVGPGARPGTPRPPNPILIGAPNASSPSAPPLPRTLLGTGPPHTLPNGVRLSALDGDPDGEEGETQLMMRGESSSAPAPGIASHETTPLSRAPDAMRGARGGRSPLRYVAVLVGILAVVAAFVAWSRLREPSSAAASPPSTPATAEAPKAAARPVATAATAATAAPPAAPSAEPTKPDEPPAAAPRATEEPAAAPPVRRAPVRGGGGRPAVPRGAGKPAPEATAAPPPPPDGDLSNPYR